MTHIPLFRNVSRSSIFLCDGPNLDWVKLFFASTQRRNAASSALDQAYEFWRPTLPCECPSTLSGLISIPSCLAPFASHPYRSLLAHLESFRLILIRQLALRSGLRPRKTNCHGATGLPLRLSSYSIRSALSYLNCTTHRLCALPASTSA